MPFLRTILTTAFLAGGMAAAHAQATPSPHEIQAQIAAGQNSAALGELQTVLQSHPDSGIAWYLSAEAQDASGNEDAARAALAKAEQYAPGLPFANPNDVAALQAHLAAPAARTGFGISPMVLVLGVLVVLFVVFRLFSRARRAVPVYQDGMAPGYANRPQYPYGPGGMPYGPGGAPGGGLGSALLGGLAAGAGIAAGERIIDDMTGNRDDSSFNQGGGFDATPAPGRDDGLQGSPSWDDGNSGFDNSGGSDTNDTW